MFCSKMILSAFLLVFLIVSSQARECYDCNSLLIPNCEEHNFDGKILNKALCDGTCIKATFTLNGKSETHRGCSTRISRGLHADTCSNVEAYIRNTYPRIAPHMPFDARLKECIECSGLLCNSASARYAMYAVPLIVMALGVYAL